MNWNKRLLETPIIGDLTKRLLRLKQVEKRTVLQITLHSFYSLK